MSSQYAINELTFAAIWSGNSFTFSKHNDEDYRWIKIGNTKYVE